MGQYRVVVRHVNWWRGVIHKWSTVYPFTGSVAGGDVPTVASTMLDHDSGLAWGATGAEEGGIYEVAVYDSATGGVPIYVLSVFPPETPADWVDYTHSGWTTAYTAQLRVLEAALALTWPAGLSRSGKPVLFRKWIHAVPNSGGVGGAVNVQSADQASLAAWSQDKLAIVAGLGLLLGNASRLAASTPDVSSQYENHQMPKGRKRKALVTAGGRYTGPTLEIPSAPEAD